MNASPSSMATADDGSSTSAGSGQHLVTVERRADVASSAGSAVARPSSSTGGMATVIGPSTDAAVSAIWAQLAPAGGQFGGGRPPVPGRAWRRRWRRSSTHRRRRHRRRAAARGTSRARRRRRRRRRPGSTPGTALPWSASSASAVSVSTAVATSSVSCSVPPVVERTASSGYETPSVTGSRRPSTTVARSAAWRPGGARGRGPRPWSRSPALGAVTGTPGAAGRRVVVVVLVVGGGEDDVEGVGHVEHDVPRLARGDGERLVGEHQRRRRPPASWAAAGVCCSRPQDDGGRGDAAEHRGEPGHRSGAVSSCITRSCSLSRWKPSDSYRPRARWLSTAVLTRPWREPPGPHPGQRVEGQRPSVAVALVVGGRRRGAAGSPGRRRRR